MAVKDGIQARNVSAPIETWQRLRTLAQRAGRPNFEVFREVMVIGLEVLEQRSQPLQFTDEELRRYRSTYQRERAKELSRDRAADALWQAAEAKDAARERQ